MGMCARILRTRWTSTKMTCWTARTPRSRCPKPHCLPRTTGEGHTAWLTTRSGRQRRSTRPPSPFPPPSLPSLSSPPSPQTPLHSPPSTHPPLLTPPLLTSAYSPPSLPHVYLFPYIFLSFSLSLLPSSPPSPPPVAWPAYRCWITSVKITSGAMTSQRRWPHSRMASDFTPSPRKGLRTIGQFASCRRGLRLPQWPRRGMASCSTRCSTGRDTITTQPGRHPPCVWPAARGPASLLRWPAYPRCAPRPWMQRRAQQGRRERLKLWCSDRHSTWQRPTPTQIERRCGAWCRHPVAGCSKSRLS